MTEGVTAEPLRTGVVEDLAARARSAAPRAGATRVAAVDGRSGAGKTTLARALADQLEAPLLQLDSMCEGWDGLAVGIDMLVDHVLAPLADGRDVIVPRYNWVADRWGTGVALPAPSLLVVEGVGAGARRVAPYLSLLIWLELADETRKERALARDGMDYELHWDRWARQEAALLEAEGIRDRADVVIDTDEAPWSVRSGRA